MDVIFEPQTGSPFSIEVGFFDTVLEIKEKIQKYQAIPISKQTLIFNGNVLQDNHNIEHCEILQGSHIQLIVSPDSDIAAIEILESSSIDVGFKGLPTNPIVARSRPTMAPPKKLKLTVLTRCGTKKIPVEMNVSDNVEELRKELEKLQQRLHFPLPEEGYFFIHKQNVMDEDQSFWWHHVGQGDTIEIFNGTVTRGS
jgi:hypothetical protein